MAYVPGKGCKLQIEDGTFQDVSQNVTISGPSQSVREDEVTHLLSTAAEFRPTIPEAGTISGTLQLDTANSVHTTMEGLINNPVMKNWKLILSDATTYSWSGFLTQWEHGGFDVGDHVEIAWAIRISGEVTRS